MKEQAMKKLKSSRGETIAETLLSVLIGALALTMLAGAVSSAANMINKSEEKMKQYYEDNEGMSSPSLSGITELSLTGANAVHLFGKDYQVTYTYAINNSFPGTPVVAYEVTATKVGGT